MYLPVTYSPAPASASGLGNYRPMSASLQESEFYPPPYNTDAPFDLSAVYGARGMGMFDSWDPTSWGFAEWSILAAGVYFGVKLFSDLGRATRAVRSARRKRKRARRRPKAPPPPFWLGTESESDDANVRRHLRRRNTGQGV